jgi:hypothetical protein
MGSTASSGRTRHIEGARLPRTSPIELLPAKAPAKAHEPGVPPELTSATRYPLDEVTTGCHASWRQNLLYFNPPDLRSEAERAGAHSALNDASRKIGSVWTMRL